METENIWTRKERTDPWDTDYPIGKPFHIVGTAIDIGTRGKNWEDKFTKIGEDMGKNNLTNELEYNEVATVELTNESIKDDLTDSQKAITHTMDSMKEFILEKNRRYGDSALHPKRVFSKATTDEQILVRLDDKISRIQNSTELRKNDIGDLVGYAMLLCVSKGWTDFSDLLD